MLYLLTHAFQSYTITRQKYLHLPKPIPNFPEVNSFMENIRAAKMRYVLTEVCTEHDITWAVTSEEMGSCTVVCSPGKTSTKLNSLSED